jgi:hypothetical protein
MADKRVNLIISLKDGVSSGMQRIKDGAAATGEAFKKMSVVALGAATAIVGGFVAIGKAWADQESVNAKLAATFTALGENGTAAVARWGAFATAIQRTTTLGDEQVMMLVTTAKTMGIANGKIEEATKGAIGLSKAFGLDLNSAMKMTALAFQGEFTMLGRYIPELRTATTQAEKMAIVQKAMGVGFQVAEAELKTINGAWISFKGVVGDAIETAGEAIFGGGGLAAGITKLKEKIIELTEGGEITFWANEIKSSFQTIGDVLTPVGNKLAYFGKGIAGAVRESGAWIGGFAGSLSAGSSMKVAWNDAGEAAKNADAEFQLRKAKSLELIQIEKEGKLETVETVAELEKQLAALDAEEAASKKVNQQSGGFADLYKKMYATGSSDYEKEQFTRFVAGQEKAGVSAGVSGAGKYAAEQRASGLSEYDVIQRVQEFIKAEVRGMAAGVQGVGAFAQQLIGQGKSSYDVGQAVSGLLTNEGIGQAISGGLSDPLAKIAESVALTNEKMEAMLTLQSDRLGGVLN